MDNVVVAGVPYTVIVAAINMAGTGRFIVKIVMTRERGMVFHSYLSYICCYLFKYVIHYIEPSISPKKITVVRISVALCECPGPVGLSLRPVDSSLTTRWPTSLYQVVANEKNSTSYQTVSNDSSETTIENLDGYTAYVVQVSASTAAGDGAYNGAIIASTHL